MCPLCLAVWKFSESTEGIAELEAKYHCCGMRSEWGLVSNDERRDALDVERVSCTAHVAQVRARVRLVQRFVNRSRTRAVANASYRFPLDARGSIHSCSIQIGDRKIVPALQELERATNTFDAAIKSGKKAGLVRQHKPDVFELSLGNIPPATACVVELTYDVCLDQSDGQTRFTLPSAVAPRYEETTYEPFPISSAKFDVPEAAAQATDVKSLATTDTKAAVVSSSGEARFSATIYVRMPSALVAIRSSTHGSSPTYHEERDRTEAGAAVVRFSQVNASLDGDFVLSIEQARPFETRAAVQWSPLLKEWMMEVLVAMPPLSGDALAEAAPARSALEFWVDCSGSMGYEGGGSGDKIGAVRQAMQALLSSMHDGHRFTMRKFGTTYESWQPEPVPYEGKALASARAWVNALGSDMGGTEMLQLVRDTLKKGPAGAEHPPQALLLTDGEIDRPEDVIAQARAHNWRIHTIGIGSGASQHLIESIARVTGGHAQMVPLGTSQESCQQAVAEAVRTAVDTLFQPAYTSATVKLPSDGKISRDEMEVWPTMRRAMFAGRFYPLYVRLGATATMPQKVVLVLNTNIEGDKPRQLELDVAREVDGDVLHRLAAKVRLQELEDAVGTVGSYDRERAAIVRTSLGYGVQCSLTAFVGVDESISPEADESASACEGMPSSPPMRATKGRSAAQPSAAAPTYLSCAGPGPAGQSSSFRMQQKSLPSASGHTLECGSPQSFPSPPTVRADTDIDPMLDWDGAASASAPVAMCRRVVVAADNEEADDDDGATNNGDAPGGKSQQVTLASLLQLQEADGSWAKAPALWAMLPTELKAGFEAFEKAYHQWLASSPGAETYAATQLARVLLRLLFAPHRPQWRLPDAKAARWQAAALRAPKPTASPRDSAISALVLAFPIAA